jgi:SpoIID/LytB domain protein
LSRRLRGEVEIALLGKGLSVVNRVDLESYTHGVLTAEMPIDSPAEALKAQAVLARTHALFIKDVRKKHRAQGYHLCDGQHCQVYRGVQAETDRSRTVVNATRGRVVSYKGSIANVLYSSNCGGHTQSSGEIPGWGEVPYFRGRKDGVAKASVPHSPWQLRQFLREPSRGYCSPSGVVHSGHSRWNRVVPAKDLEARLDRHLGIGKLKALVPLKRSRSGHLNSILVRGSKKSRVVDSEIKIRGLFGVGSQRSSLFVFDTRLDAEGRLKDFVFYGGGWGHGVGLCQSGAMGRAQRGHSYPEILQAYYTGIEIGNLRY